MIPPGNQKNALSEVPVPVAKKKGFAALAPARDILWIALAMGDLLLQSSTQPTLLHPCHYHACFPKHPKFSQALIFKHQGWEHVPPSTSHSDHLSR
mmetsp:Transcript_41197/g.76603  ORF Transcript_41197/g.76603 Transcript_41197/m.76603 type:complete len:96 (-) Transcript_41197:738-1025(-)